MNERIRLLAEQAEWSVRWGNPNNYEEYNRALDEWQEKFAELIKQAIYDVVKEELIDDAIINEESDPLAREYLKGCNGGTIDALCHIKNFGVEIEL